MSDILEKLAVIKQLSKRQLISREHQAQMTYQAWAARRQNAKGSSEKKAVNEMVDAIMTDQLNEANDIVAELFFDILRKKLLEMKKMIAAEIAEEALDEEVLDEAPRIRLIKARIRNGKVQRRVKKSNVKGFTLKGGRLKRIPPAEKMHRKRGAIKAARKRKAKVAQIRRKMKMSLRKRKSMGIK